jgi:4-amino-4-deoxy-L-arabinose transferase-like glycosyltransferase
MGNSLDSSTLAYLQQHQGTAKYLVAVFGAQTAAGIILATDGASVLPIGGFSGTDAVPTLAEFQKMVADGDVKYVLVSGTGTNGGGAGGNASSSTSTQIQTWVTENCTQVTASGVSGLYQCGASDDS